MTDPLALHSAGAGRDDAVRPLVADQAARVLASLPDGVAVVDAAGGIQWANHQLCQWCQERAREGVNIFDALGRPNIEGSSRAPLETALQGRVASDATLRTADNRYFHLHAAPFDDGTTAAPRLVVAVRDVTHTILEQQKRAAIHQAGQTLADLSPTELADMTVAERIELLKSNIIHYAKDLLQFDVVEIRLLDQRTGRLETLLSEGMQPEAEARILYAKPENNGVTGWVAATGQSYRCSDTLQDPLYLEGCKGAKSSMTVPLMMHDQVIGTFNSEENFADLPLLLSNFL